MPATVSDLPPREEQAFRLWTLFQEDGPGGLTIAASSLRSADLAGCLEVLDSERRKQLFLALPADLAAEALEELTPETRDELLDVAGDERLIAILSQASADDAVYFLDHLDEDRAETLLGKLDQRLRDKLEQQYELPEGSAGRMMQRRVLTLPAFNTVVQAIDKLRRTDPQQYGAIYVVDTEGRLIGVLSLRELVFAKPNAALGTIMNTDLIVAKLTDDAEDVAREMQRYHLFAIPVVDEAGKLCGMVTWDDAADILEAEAEEDILAVAGTAESLEDNESILGRARHRLPYLMMTTVGGFVTATVIGGFQGVVEQQNMLVAFMPLIPALAGNVGIQCSTVTLRSLANENIGVDRQRERARREIATGLSLAFALAILAGTGAALLSSLHHAPSALALVVIMAMLVAISLAAAFGVAVPMACERFGIDPAIAAGPFVTMLNDIGGMTIYLGTAYLLLPIIL